MIVFQVKGPQVQHTKR